MARRFAPAFRALGVCEHICPFSLRDICAEISVAQMDPAPLTSC